MSQNLILRKHFNNIQLNQYEYNCLKGLLEHNSIDATAKAMKLSYHTVEYCLKNIKAKLDKSFICAD